MNAARAGAMLAGDESFFPTTLCIIDRRKDRFKTLGSQRASAWTTRRRKSQKPKILKTGSRDDGFPRKTRSKTLHYWTGKTTPHVPMQTDARPVRGMQGEDVVRVQVLSLVSGVQSRTHGGQRRCVATS